MQLRECRTQEKVRLKIVGGKANGFLESGDRLVRMFGSVEAEPNQIIQAGGVWFKLESRAKSFDGTIVSLVVAEPHAQFGEGWRIRMGVDFCLYRRRTIAARAHRSRWRRKTSSDHYCQAGFGKHR